MVEGVDGLTARVASLSESGHAVASGLRERSRRTEGRLRHMTRPGELAIVLHSHMPYVEGFGTWPFGEEWLWEAVAGSYLPLLKVLDAHGSEATRAQLTLSLTPVLCDQLEAAGTMERCVEFLREVRPASHELDIATFRAEREEGAVAVLERSAAEYADAAQRLWTLSLTESGLLGALGAHASWTSSASHAILPLLALHESLDLQLQTGIRSHRRRFGDWGGGFWLPECAHAPWLNPLLSEAGVRMTCVELSGQFNVGDSRHLTPLAPDDGPALLPIDRLVIDMVWGAGGYPSRAPYRDHPRRTPHDHHVWANDGTIYDQARARAQARADAAEFIEAVKVRIAGGGLCVCALDTELLGHWWYEGPVWLEALLNQAQSRGLTLTTLDEAMLERHPPTPADPAAVAFTTSWGEGGDLRTWSAPPVADLAWQVRSAELRAFLGTDAAPGPRALRELLALQSSDWAFLAYRGWSGDYPRQRASGHAAQFELALRGESEQLSLRNLAPYLG
jgi:1,4-alpha-glucan branching enzyme